MLHLFLDYDVGALGIIGANFHDIPLFASLLLILVYVFIPYLLGSVNTAIIVSGRMYHDDVRKYGSGNAGFTNVMRIYGKKAAVLTLAGDILKTVAAILIGWCVFGYYTAYIAALACLVGHVFPVFYRFRGGKGVLCLGTSLLMLDWRLFLILFAIFVVVVLVTKYISAGSVIGAMFFPILLNRMNDTDKFFRFVNEAGEYVNYKLYSIEIIAFIMTVIIVVKHKDNIKRVLNGTESKFKIKKSKSADGEPEEK